MSLTKDEALEVVKKFGKDEKDTGSTAVQIALLTKRIEDLQGITFASKHIYLFLLSVVASDSARVFLPTRVG